ncbi:type II CAAX endopeptidase family protein [Salinirubellus sp. GCM10025818]|uniref:CPBP family intramembrane glutamic endopeptidase n=1 Tax=Salinirubellus TaxID=2162630 RepID=UPI0030D2C374
MTDWAAFTGIAVALLALLLVLARASQSYVGPTITPAERAWLSGLPDGADHLDTGDATTPTGRSEPLSGGALLVNVALSQGLFGFVLVVGAWYTEVPLEALGLGSAPLATGVPALAWGLALGLVLAGANAVGVAVAGRFGYAAGTELRELLSPETRRGWLLLLGVALPTVAVVEELLFRATLIGAFAVGFGVSPWLLAVLSSIAFAVGHGAQGPAGIAVTGLLGFVLAAAFVLTGSLVVVAVAHYLVNAVEFLRYEAPRRSSAG